MLFTTLLALCGLAVADGEDGNTWAVLIAGSNTYMNYRHQADVCDAYGMLSKLGGIPDERIIVLMADDIANNAENPIKGNIINVPHGKNVYPGVPKDYTGKSVNKHTFLNVLKGNDTATGMNKVLKSTENDNVFVYYADHGATGLVAMPFGDELYADELLDAVKYMYEHKMYKKLVLYVEACESGSMFANKLPTTISAYAVTAANSAESSYACYWDEKRHTYLADAWSINYLRDSKANMLNKEDLDKQFTTVKNMTTASHSMRFGSMDFVSDLVEFFQGQSGNTSSPIPAKKEPNCSLPVSSRDVRLESFKRRWESATSQVEKAFFQHEIEEEVARRVHIEYTFRDIIDIAVKGSTAEGLPHSFEDWMGLHSEPMDFDALRHLNSVFKSHCFTFDEFSYKFFTLLVSLNEKLGTDSTQLVEAAIRKVCPHPELSSHTITV